MNKEYILKKLQENLSQIRSFGINHIGLFGSALRDEMSHTSDLDFVIEFKQGEKTFDNFMETKFLLEDIFDRNVDLVIRDNIKEELKESILKDVVYAA